MPASRIFKKSLILAAILLHIPAQSAAHADTPSVPYLWKNVTIEGGGFVTGIVNHPTEHGLTYIRTDIGGAYRRDRPSDPWIPLTDWVGNDNANLLGCESVAIDPSDPQRVYLALGTYASRWAGNGVIARSTNRGATFDRTELPLKMGSNNSGRTVGERLAVDPRDGHILFFGSRTDGLWTSHDYAAHWNKVTTFPDAAEKAAPLGIAFLTFDTNNAPEHQPSSTIYAGICTTSTNLFRTTNAGRAWSPVPAAPTALMPIHAALASTGLLYITYGKQPGPERMDDGAIWRLNTNDGQWKEITPVKPTPNTTFGYAGIAVSPSNPRIVMATTFCRWGPGDSIFRSTDGGDTWTEISVRKPDPRKALFDAASAPYAAAITPHWMSTIAIDPFDSNHVTFVTGFGLWSTTQPGNMEARQPTHWFFDNRGLEETAALKLVSPPTGAHLISAIGDYDGFRHDDLDDAPPGGRHQPSVGTTRALDFAGQSPNMFVRAGENGRGFYSDDGAATWKPFAGKPSDSQKPRAIALSADGQSIVWTCATAAPAFSHDHGTTWTPCGNLPPGTTVLSDRTVANTFYASDRRGAFYRSDNGGATFVAIHALLSPGTLVASPAAPGDLWLAAGDKGLFHSANAGTSFDPLPTIPRCTGIGFGKPAPGKNYPALYATGKIGNVSGIFRSDDQGLSWLRINDDQHQFGGIGSLIIGDPRIYGRVYLGTNGRGILYADPVTATTAP